MITYKKNEMRKKAYALIKIKSSIQDGVLHDTERSDTHSKYNLYRISPIVQRLILSTPTIRRHKSRSPQFVFV